MSTKNVYDIIREAIDAAPELSDQSIAINVLATVGVNGRASMTLTPVVAAAVETLRRAPVRQTERRVFGQARTLGETVDVVALRAELSAEFFSLGDGRRVRWGEATVEQHRERIDLLEKQIAGIRYTVDAHAQAIVEIEAAGVSCLDEIPGEGVA